MDTSYSTKDRFKRVIYLTSERWKHIATRHPELSNALYEILQTVSGISSIIIRDKITREIHYYHRYNKKRKNYLIVVVKYINDEGLIITALNNKHLKK